MLVLTPVYDVLYCVLLQELKGIYHVQIIDVKDLAVERFQDLYLDNQTKDDENSAVMAQELFRVKSVSTTPQPPSVS